MSGKAANNEQSKLINASILALLLRGVLIFAAGCGAKEHLFFWPKNSTQKEEVRTGDAGTAQSGSAESMDGEQTVDGLQKDQATESYPEENIGGESRPPGRSVPELPPVFFEFDKYDLTESTRAALAQHITYLKNNPELQVIIRGHTDTEGTEEYNIALGSRRAQAVRDYMIDEGISGKRLETISYGEGLPAEEGVDREANAKNRRAEFFLYE